MITGIGTDIVEVDRIRAAIERRKTAFINRIFTSGEQEYCQNAKDSAVCFSGRFAAKEAVLKALGTGLREMRWQDIEIIRDELGKPSVQLSAAAALLAQKRGVSRILLSISHTQEHALAFAIACREEGDLSAHCAVE